MASGVPSSGHGWSVAFAAGFMFVKIAPGEIELTLIFMGANSTAAVLVRLTTALFDAG